MEKDRFLFLMKNYTSLTAEEGSMLASLQVQFPYSQVVHNLAARAAQDNTLTSRDALLHISAIYTTDRVVLKSIMTAPKSARAVAPVVIPIPEESAVVQHQTRAPGSVAGVIAITPEGSLSGEALRKDIIQEMKKLKVSKHHFEVLAEEYDKVHAEGLKKQKTTNKKGKPIEPADALIEEIKISKKKVNPEGKQKEQIEIIENFIKAKPSIAKNKVSTPNNNADLADQSLSYGDNIVSETLVEILLKQGKKDKAVEVLKKLIWKFPQKKAYFAAQIEELKK